MSKYKNKVIKTPDGQKWDSKKELRRFAILSIKEQNGEIRDLQRQVKFTLIPAQREPDIIGPRGGVKQGKVIEQSLCYYADFVYIDSKTGDKVVEDVKGYKKGNAYAIFKIKKKLMRYMHGIEVKEV